MKNITVWIITSVLLAGAAVAYISKEFEDREPSVEYSEESTEASTLKEKEGIKPEDVIYFDPLAIGKSVVERDGMVFVDLEGEGSSDETEELKAFQKYGYLRFNGKIRIEFNPSYFVGYYWKITLSFDKRNEKLGTIELPWGKITVLEPTYAYLDFGSLRKCEENYFTICRDRNGGEDNPEIKNFAIQCIKPYADSYKIYNRISLVRIIDEQTGGWSDYL